MSVPKTLMTCPSCYKNVPAARSHCTACGMALRLEAVARTEVAGRSDIETGYSGILRLAEDAKSPSKPSPSRPQAKGNGSARAIDDVRPGPSREEIRLAFQPSAPRTTAQQQPGNSSAAGSQDQSSQETLTSMEIEGETPRPENRESAASSQSDVIRLTCKSCGRKMRVKKDRSGQKIKCPKCEQPIRVPRVRDTSNAGESSGSQTNPEISFTDLAMQMEPLESPTDSENPQGKSSPAIKTSDKKTLSGRNYRRLTNLLHLKESLDAQQIRQRALDLKELGQSGDPRGYDWLVADLEHRELSIRQAAAVGLGDLGDARCVPLLVGLLDDPSMVMRKAAILGLGKIKDPRAVEPLLLFGLNDPQMKFLAAEAVTAMGQDALQTLIELLEHKELGIVRDAVVLLGRLKNPKARRALLAVIDSGPPLVQCHAIEALGQIADSKSVGPLVRLLEADAANIRVAAASALAKMASDKNIVAPLVKALSDSEEEVVIQAAHGLGESGDKRAAEPLSRMLRSCHEPIRVAAAQALGALGDQRAVPHLLALLEGASEETQIKVLTTLRAMKPPHISGPLLKHLNHQSAAVRRRVVDVLGPIGDAEVAERLEALLRMDPADEVRMAAARSLGEIADPASVDCLKAAVHNDEFNVRCQAIGALGRIGDEECLSTLLALLEDQVSEVRFHAAVALGELGDKNAVPALKEMLKDKNPMVARGASKSLEKLGVENVERLVKAANRSKKMKVLNELVLTVQSWFPDSVHTQKILLGGSLAVFLVFGGLGWLVYAMFQDPPTKVVIRGNVRSLAFLPDGSKVAVGRTFGLLEVWNTDSASLEESYVPPPRGECSQRPTPRRWPSSEPRQFNSRRSGRRTKSPRNPDNPNPSLGLSQRRTNHCSRL